MKAVFLTCLVLIGLTAPLYANSATCRSSSDCGDDGCCVLSPMRYSTPHCEKLRQEGEICRPSAEPFNTTAHYPDESIALTNVFYILCPCNHGLSCEAQTGGVCTATSEQGNQLAHDAAPEHD